MKQPKVIGRIDMSTGKWIVKTRWYYINWIKSHAAMLFCIAGFLYFVIRTIVG